MKRQKTGDESHPDFKNLFESVFKEDESGMSQDVCSLYDPLTTLVKHFETPSAVTFFRSTEAKQKPSRARDMVESGVRFANQIQEENLARVIFAAILLGGSTLTKFINVVKEIDQNKPSTVTKKLR